MSLKYCQKSLGLTFIYLSRALGVPGFQVIAHYYSKSSLILTLTVNLGPNNAWTGTLGAVKNKTSLIGIGLLKVTYRGYKIVDFIGPLGGQESRLAQRRPRPIKSHWASSIIQLFNNF